MPEFAPGDSKVAVATFPVKPAGLPCSAELWLPSNGAKAATSGEIPFTSTGVNQSISLPITMPGAAGTYPVYLDILSGGQFIRGFRAYENIVIVPVGVAEFAYVSDVRCAPTGRIYYGTPIWRGSVDIKNIGNAPGVCSVKLYYRTYIPKAGIGWSAWTEGNGAYIGAFYCLLSATLQPGQTKTFYDEFDFEFNWVTAMQVYFTGSPGTSPTLQVTA